jgi:hypothetical protein
VPSSTDLPRTAPTRRRGLEGVPLPEVMAQLEGEARAQHGLLIFIAVVNNVSLAAAWMCQI